jgi:NAD(P)-dependent dehydrogenase (short-subunit alcohol dehydrogenase family)
MLRFEGRVVVVTGGTGALGAAVVAQIVREGGACYVPGHRDASVPNVSGPGCVQIMPGVDLADETAVERFYAALPSLWASVHCAGGFAMGPIADIRKQDLAQMMHMNTLSAFLSCREAVKRMRASGQGGRIVNVAAKAAVQPVGGMVPYSMSKAAVVALTQSLAEEVATERIWVNAVLPSIMDTPANRAAFPAGTDFSKWPKVEEVAATIAFLASAENLVTRGALVPVYGKS